MTSTLGTVCIFLKHWCGRNRLKCNLPRRVLTPYSDLLTCVVYFLFTVSPSLFKKLTMSINDILPPNICVRTICLQVNKDCSKSSSLFLYLSIENKTPNSPNYITSQSAPPFHQSPQCYQHPLLMLDAPIVVTVTSKRPSLLLFPLFFNFLSPGLWRSEKWNSLIGHKTCWKQNTLVRTGYY